MKLCLLVDIINEMKSEHMKWEIIIYALASHISIHKSSSTVSGVHEEKDWIGVGGDHPASYLWGWELGEKVDAILLGVYATGDYEEEEKVHMQNEDEESWRSSRVWLLPRNEAFM